MPGALAGVASCARCGGMQTTAGVLCQSCGTALTPRRAGECARHLYAINCRRGPDECATRQSGGIDRRASARGRWGSRRRRGGFWRIRDGGVDWHTQRAIPHWPVALVRPRGRTLGRLVLSLRTVDDLTGNPVTVRKMLASFTSSHWIRRTVTANLTRGRDPLTLALAPLTAAALAEDSRWDAAVFATSGPAVAVTTTSDAVAIVFDTGRRQVIRSSLLIGRSPESSRISEDRDTVGAAGEQPVLALADLSRTLSKTHALLEWSGSVLWVTDLHSANGSVLVSPDGERRPLVPGIRGPAAIGWRVECGSRFFTVHAAPQRAAS
jgi:hypothetical protein